MTDLDSREDIVEKVTQIDVSTFDSVVVQGWLEGQKLRVLAVLKGYIEQNRQLVRVNETSPTTNAQDERDPVEEINRTINQMLEWLKTGYYFAIIAADQLSLPDEIILSPAVQLSATTGVIYLIERGYVDEPIRLAERFLLPPDVIKSALATRVESLLADGKVVQLPFVLNIITRINPQLTINLVSPEFQEAAKAGVKLLLQTGKREDAQRLREMASLPLEDSSIVG